MAYDDHIENVTPNGATNMGKKAHIDLENPQTMSYYMRKKMGLVGTTSNVVSIQTAKPIVVETDAQIRTKLKSRFNVLEKMTHGVCEGVVRAMVVSGPAGVGKSFTIDQICDKYESEGKRVTRVKGFVRATGLYRTLLENRDEDCIVVFDDADSIFNDTTCLNLLKAACDSTEERHISWLSETKMTDEEGERLETSFQFDGSIIFITNYDFEDMIDRGHNLAPHFEALISRSLYIDLAMKTKRDYLVRIQTVIEGSDMLRANGLNKRQADALLAYLNEHYENLRELSLRMVIKLAGLIKMDENTWEEMAKVACYKYP